MALDKNVPLVTNTIAADLIAINANWEAIVSDTAYDATTWDGVTDIAPSKNVVRDKIVTIDAAIAANTAKNTNVPTALSVGTVNTNTVSITSDGSADDVTLPAATASTAGMLTTAKWAEIVANTNKVTNATHTGDVTGATALTIAAAAVGQAQLKTALHEQSTITTTWVEKVLTYSEYGFGALIKTNAGAFVATLKRSDEANPSITGSTSYVGESVFLDAGGSGYTAYVAQRYVTASGEVFWVWLLRDKITKQILDAEACSDHCSFGYKDPSEREHPFNNYNPDKHEIILYNPTKEELERIYAIENGRGILQTVLEDFEVDEKSQAIWPDIPVTVKIKNHDWFDRYISKEPVDIIKKVIPKVGYISCKKMKLRARG